MVNEPAEVKHFATESAKPGTPTLAGILAHFWQSTCPPTSLVCFNSKDLSMTKNKVVTLCVITHTLKQGEKMTKTWNEYSNTRIAKMSRKDLEFHNLLRQQYQIASQVLGARKKRNLTQLQLAQLSGVQQADISRIENGHSFPTTETLAKLLQALQAKVKIELVG